MPAGIQGKVFNDLNHNGRWAVGEPGIENCYIVLEYPDGTFSKTSTDINGDYFFTGITIPGTHKLYNVYLDPGTVTIPPVDCYFPPGVNGLTSWRRWDLSITQTQINNSTTIVDANNSGTSSTNRTYFGYDYTEQFNVPYGIIVAGNIQYVDILNGVVINSGVSGGSLNGMGFGVLDNFVYGAMPAALSRLSADGTVFNYPTPPGAAIHNGGDTDQFGHLYVVRSGGYYCHDISPFRSTFGRSLDSQNGFVEITDGSPALPYGPGVSVAAAETLYRYSDFRVYRPAGSIAYYMDVRTGLGGNIPITGGNVTISGVGFLDNVGNGYLGGQSRRLIDFLPDTAPTTVASEAFVNFGLGTGDGARNGLLPIYFAVPSTNKIVDKTNASIGDTLNYTLEITNTGNIEANILSVIDTIPEGTVFVDDSLALNGTTIPGATILPPTGFSDPTTVPIGDVATVTFQVTIESLPQDSITLPNKSFSTFQFIDLQTSLPYSQSLESNTVNTRVISADFDPIKSFDLENVTIGNTINYSVTFTNNGNADALNVLFIDTIPDGTSFVSDSLYVNGVNVVGESPEPPNGYNLLTIPVGEVTTVSFTVSVDTLPISSYSIPNTAILDFYVEDPVSGDTLPATVLTNEVVSNIFVVNVDGINKDTDKNFTTNGQTITYTIAIPNTGNTNVINALFKDTIPNGTTFVPGSVLVNGSSTGENPETGINIGTIGPNEISTVVFQVVVD